MVMDSALQQSQWHAQLNLRFAVKNNKTTLSGRSHVGPLVVQKPFYPEGDTCHIYVLHPPGGVVGGDHLSIFCQLDQNAHTLITTPAANKFYRSAGEVAVVQQNLTVNEGALLEWLPQETIVFDQSKIKATTQVHLAGHARFIGWDILCLGRPASGEAFLSGHYRQSFAVFKDEKPLIMERALYQGGDALFEAKWGMQQQTTTGTMIIAPANKKMLEFVRENVQSNASGLFSATLINSVLLCRYLGPSAENAKQQFIKVWDIARQELIARPSCPPRIWST